MKETKKENLSAPEKTKQTENEKLERLNREWKKAHCVQCGAALESYEVGLQETCEDCFYAVLD